MGPEIASFSDQFSAGGGSIVESRVPGNGRQFVFLQFQLDPPGPRFVRQANRSSRNRVYLNGRIDDVTRGEPGELFFDLL